MSAGTMRAVRTLGWAVVGALPSVIALPGLIESQGENLGLVFCGFGLAIAGASLGRSAVGRRIRALDGG